MKNLKNKFILGILFLGIVIILFQVYVAFSQNANDTNSYLTLLKGKAILNNEPISLEQDIILHSGDSILTLDDSLAVIKWGDGSMTRLASNTKIQIHQSDISPDFSEIQIHFELLSGKTWSQVVSFLGEESSFTQSFQGVEAGVRGTVFDVDMEKSFVHVTDHLVTLTREDGTSIEVEQGKTLDYKKFSFVELYQYLKSLKDADWSQLNTALDEENREKLLARVESLGSKSPFLLKILSFVSPEYKVYFLLEQTADFSLVKESLQNLNSNQRQRVYERVYKTYQSLNFVEITQEQYYKKKILYKRTLISLETNPQNIERLAQSSRYDLQEAIEKKLGVQMEETLGFLVDAKTLFPEMKLNFSLSLEAIPEDLRKQFSDQLEFLQGFFYLPKITLPSGNILDTLDQKAQNLLDSSAGKILDSLE